MLNGFGIQNFNSANQARDLSIEEIRKITNEYSDKVKELLTLIPSKPADKKTLEQRMTNPTTGSLTKGYICSGVFEDLSNRNPNNNRRYYKLDDSLVWLYNIYQMMISPRGLFGELDHPRSISEQDMSNVYEVDLSNISHKIIDLYFDKSTECVCGSVLILDNPTGRLAMDIINTGSSLGISARSMGGDEKLNDGSEIVNKTYMVTYDLVKNPGFDKCILDYVSKNENANIRSNTGSIDINNRNIFNGLKNAQLFGELEAKKNFFESEYIKQTKTNKKQDKQAQQQAQQELDTDELPEKKELQDKLTTVVNQSKRYLKKSN